MKVSRVPGNLPRRAADNLFWLGRDLERAEATLRVVRLICNRMTEAQVGSTHRQPIEGCGRLLVAWGAAPSSPGAPIGAALALAAAASRAEQYGSARAIAAQAMRAAVRRSLRLDSSGPDQRNVRG